MKGITKTRCAHYIWCLRFCYRILDR